MEFRTVFVLWLLVLVPYALGATKRFKRDAMETANQNANQTLDNMQSNTQDWLKEVKSGLSAEQQKRLDTIGSSNPELLRELFELMQKHADDTDGDEFKQAAKALVEKYLNGSAGPQSDIPDIPNIPGIPNIPDIPDWFNEVASSFSAEQQKRLMTIASSNTNFLREFGELQQKHAGETDTDEFKQAVKALAERYVNGGAGLVVSLVALVASLVVQGLMMFG
ncbi:uncharacterized protein [Littorina saxatilis]|uniref:uncharacterized protein isoform X1 n=1 Tax=Littorina saxatilis TaxID=31220 RepID=UPI0038B4DC4B